MPNLYQARDALDARPAIVANHAGDIQSDRGFAIITAALVAADVIEICKLAADHVITDLILDTDKLDSNGAPTITLDIGFMSGLPGKVDATRTIAQDFAAAATTGQQGGVFRPTLLTGFRQSPVGYDRSIGVKVNAGPATGVAPLAGLTNNRGLWQPNTAYAVADYVTLADGRRLKCTTAGVSQATPAAPIVVGGLWQPPAFAPTAYNATVNDGTAVWTMADFAVGLLIEFRWGRGGF